MPILCHQSEINEGESRGFSTQELGNVFVVNKNQQFYAYKNQCPHLGIELEWQEHDFLDHQASLIQCSTHGALFLIENGKCVAGPCLGQFLQPLKIVINVEGFILVTP